MATIRVKKWDRLNKEVGSEVSLDVSVIEKVRGKHYMLEKKKIKGRVPSYEGSVITIKGQGECFCAETEEVVREKMSKAAAEVASESAEETSSEGQ